VISEDDPQFAGGSYVMVQKYLHDLAGWDALPVAEQELRIGRSKLSDIEMPDEVKPTNSHVALNTIVADDGKERQIVRYNMPFGRVGTREFGTYFIGYAKDPEVTEQMLTNMFVGKPPGNYDRILDFSRPVTGNLFFVPFAHFLDDPPGALTTASTQQAAGAVGLAAATPVGRSVQGDGSLGIGSLREGRA
jgi:putative iron-dependent peroxidase